MVMIFFILAAAGVSALLFYIVTALNALEKSVATFAEKVSRHYES